MLLYVVRHAWTPERDESQWPDDSLRPLTEEGRKRFSKMAKRMVRRGVCPQWIGTSPLVRCRQTAEILADRLDDEVVIEDVPSLAPGGSREQIVHWAQGKAVDHDIIAVVGHSPDVDELCAALIGDQEVRIRMAKGAIAAIEFPAVPALGRGELRWLATAKIVGC